MSSLESDEIGLIIHGANEERPLYFYAVAGLNLNQENYTFFSATGTPEDKPFSYLDLEEEPGKLRDQIIETKFRLTDQKKNFYTETVENELERVLEEHFDEIMECLEADETGDELESLFQESVQAFRISKINLSVKDIEELQFDDDGESGAETDSKESAEETFQTTVSEHVNVITINPVIDVVNGREVESLEPGTDIKVQYDRRWQPDDDEESGTRASPIASATFLEFVCNQDESEGSLLVQFDENFLGRGEVSRGSLIKPARASQGSEGLPDELLMALFVGLSIAGVTILLFLLMMLV